ncbi:PAS domain-containing sensor histidine kinase [Haladaptatus sp. W1]|uniref:PAS domain-containing protein n=1 Tax=Haladaptatus sp. W1 TaxID=1897478 RepID=UPI000849A213|nr:PAS domain S-box protein [Haladaptatus sp. W1]ODR81028.1 PAS domain-containing sensor histidine kinase [Haladaptatus sp. W1]
MNPENAAREALDRIGDGGEPFSTREFATELGCRPDVAVTNLEEFAERGVVKGKELPSGNRVWWRDGDFERNDDSQFHSLVEEVEEYAIFMLDPEGHIVTWNKGAEKIKGYTADEIIGEHFSKFYTEADTEAGIPEHHREIAVERGRTEYEGYRVRKDGTQFWANVVITALWTDDGELRGFTKVTRDMTERRAAKQRLEEERDLIEQALETVPVGIAVVSSDGTFVRANSRVIDRLGIEESKLDRYTVRSWDLYDEDDESIPPDDRPFARVAETGDPVVDFRCQFHLEGEGRRWLSLNVAPIDDGDEIDRLVYAIDDVTEQKERTDQLLRERNQTERLLETSPVGIYVQDADGEILLANRRAQELLGQSEEEFQKKSDDADEWRTLDANGEPLADGKSPAERVHSTGETVYDEEIAIEKPDGERLWLSISAGPVYGPDGELERVISTGEDITDLKQREHELERRRSELETELSEILGRVSDAFFALDDDWRFTHVNDRAEDILPESSEVVLERRFWDVLPTATETDMWEEFHTAMDTQEPTNFELNDERLGIWIEMNAYPSETGLSVYFHDITDRKERERRLEQFASIVSHDLRNPLSIAQMYLAEAEMNGRESDFEEVKRAHDRMERIIRNLLRMAQNKGTAIEPSDVSLPSIVERAWKHVKTFDATLSVEGAMPTVLADEDRLRTVFENLFRNAVEHGGEDVAVRVGALSDGFFVEDDGPGIPHDERSEVFDYGHTSGNGTGYGLTIVTECVEDHGWEIDVTESSNGGARFEIRGVTEGSTRTRPQ